MDLKYGDKIEVYRNLHKKCFSVRHKGKVVGYLEDDDYLEMDDVKFVVQPAGRKRVLRENRKNVHAFLRGTYVNSRKFQMKLDLLGVHCKVSYNPYKADTFMATNLDKYDINYGITSPVRRAPMVKIRGGVYIPRYHTQPGEK